MDLKSAARARSTIWFRSSRPRWATPMCWRDGTAEGIALLTKALALSRANKFTYGEAWSSAYLGFAQLLGQRARGNARSCASVLDLARKHKYRAIEADALRLLGDVYRSGPATGCRRSRAPLSAGVRNMRRTRIAAGICALPDRSRANAEAIRPPGGGRAVIRRRPHNSVAVWGWSCRTFTSTSQPSSMHL